MCLATLDESGDSGVRKLVTENKPSPYFSVAAVVFPDVAQASACEERINELRQELGMKKDEEFKFSRSGDRRRRKFLTAVAAFPFLYAVTTLDKGRLSGKAWHRKDYVYWEAAWRTLDLIRPHLLEAKLFIDKSSDRFFDKEMCKKLTRHAGEYEGVPVISDAKPYDSEKHNLVQLVDMVCGAVVRRYKHESDGGGDRYRNLIIAKEIEIQIWPPPEDG